MISWLNKPIINDTNQTIFFLHMPCDILIYKTN